MLVAFERVSSERVADDFGSKTQRADRLADLQRAMQIIQWIHYRLQVQYEMQQENGPQPRPIHCATLDPCGFCRARRERESARARERRRARRRSRSCQLVDEIKSKQLFDPGKGLGVY